jgi:prepilin-type N-terminal cleavage/methylation domain-containing protein
MRRRHDKGFSLVEAMVAMSISTIVVMGGMAALQVSARLVQQGTLKTRALALAQGRLEAKRSVRWEALFQDDLDHDGRTDVMMADDGQGADVSAGDGIYSARWERDGVTLKWTVAMDRLGPLSR